MTFKGLLYVKHGRIGTKSEGPDYWLQTLDREYLLRIHERKLWAPDFELEFYNRRIVEVEGQLERHDGEYINVIGLEILSASYLHELEQPG